MKNNLLARGKSRWLIMTSNVLNIYPSSQQVAEHEPDWVSGVQGRRHRYERDPTVR